MNKGLKKNWVVDEKYPACTLREALTHYLDITTSLSQKILTHLAQQTSDESEQIRLKNLANVK